MINMKILITILGLLLSGIVHGQTAPASQQSSDFSGAQTAYKQINGIDLAYRQFGAGEPVLLYNRFRGIMDTWDPLFLDALSRHYLVVVFDYPGVGSSKGQLPTELGEAGSVGVQLMESLGHPKFHVGGWSYGGLVAQVVMFGHKDKVLKSILIGCNPPGKNEVPMEMKFGMTAMKPTYELEDEIILFFEPDSETSRQAAKESHDRIAARVNPDLIPSDPETLKRYQMGMMRFGMDSLNLREHYKTLATPTLVIAGDHDISFSPKNWVPLYTHAPLLQQLILPDSGHGSLNQYPELVAGYIHVFLSQD